MSVNDLADAVAQIVNGNTDANAHTVTHPGSAVQGQIDMQTQR
jgi:hypothetical protein